MGSRASELSSPTWDPRGANGGMGTCVGERYVGEGSARAFGAHSLSSLKAGLTVPAA